LTRQDEERPPEFPLKNAEGIREVRTRWRRSGIGGGRRGLVGMVRLGAIGRRVCVLSGVILNEGGWRRKWVWSTGAGETIIEAQNGELSAWEQYSGDRDAIEVSQWQIS